MSTGRGGFDALPQKKQHHRSFTRHHVFFIIFHLTMRKIIAYFPFNVKKAELSFHEVSLNTGGSAFLCAEKCVRRQCDHI